jgi:hypothetical protein
MKELEENFKEVLDEINFEFKYIEGSLRYCFAELKERNEFKYLILIVSDENLDLGAIVKFENQKSNLFYHISYIDFLVEKNFLPKEEIENFKKIYDSKVGYLCMILVLNDVVKNVYIPFE